MSQSSAEPSKENQDLTTINYHTLNGLREESQPNEMQSAAKQGSASQEVGELISTCYADEKKDHSVRPNQARN